MQMKGYVYILLNSSLPGLIKVGKTTKQPEARARELSQTGVPTAFVVAYSEFVNDCNELESYMHLQLDKYRESSRREFFRIDSTTAIRLLMESASPHRVGERGDEEIDEIRPCSFYAYELAPEGYEEERKDFGYLRLRRSLVDSNEIIELLGSKWGPGWRGSGSDEILRFYPMRGNGPHKNVYRIGLTTYDESDLDSGISAYFKVLGIHARLQRRAYFPCHNGLDLGTVLGDYIDSVIPKQEHILYIDRSQFSTLLTQIRSASDDQRETAQRKEELLYRQRELARLRAKL